jgi:histidine triad (HIT) family protein
MDCIFCKIAAKEIDSKVVLETDDLIVIEDVNPQAPTHLLIIPKKHFSTIIDCDDKGLMGEMLATSVEVAKKAGIAESGFRTVVNTNDEGGQTVFHLHMHVLGGRPQTGKMG